MQSNFDSLVSKLDTDKERIGELQDRSTETFQLKHKEKKSVFKKNRT